jgi:hypothetical protein
MHLPPAASHLAQQAAQRQRPGVRPRTLVTRSTGRRRPGPLDQPLASVFAYRTVRARSRPPTPSHSAAGERSTEIDRVDSRRPRAGFRPLFFQPPCRRRPSWGTVGACRCPVGRLYGTPRWKCAMVMGAIGDCDLLLCQLPGRNGCLGERIVVISGLWRPTCRVRTAERAGQGGSSCGLLPRSTALSRSRRSRCARYGWGNA